VFRQLRQAKFDNGGSILSSRQFLTTASAALKNEAHFKSGQNRLKMNGLLTTILIRETHCRNTFF
jgi:hypothetical protein